MRDDLERVCRCLPVFPLPRAVLMPGEVLPLHIFEPRYRALIRYCLDTDKVMGIATPLQDQHQERVPAIYPEVGIGEIVAHQGFQDGRSNIVIRYVGRALVHRELPSAHAFRLVDAALQPDHDVGERLDLGPLRALLLQLGAVSEEAGPEARRLVTMDDAPLLDTLARKLLTEPAMRREYLRATTLRARADLVTPILATFIQMGGPAGEA